MLGHPVKINVFHRRIKIEQMNAWNYTNFESNLAMMMIYLLVKLEFDLNLKVFLS